jgi:voltage-gated potassium channel
MDAPASPEPRPSSRDVDDDAASKSLLGPAPETEDTGRERFAALLEQRLDPIMAVLAVAWGAFVAYDLVAPARQRPALSLISDVVWAIFLLEFVTKLAVSGRPLRFLRRRWPSVFFLAVPLLRTARIIPALRTLRILPTARVIGSSYRAIGTARGLLGGRLSFLAVTTVSVVVAGAQLLYLLDGSGESFGETLWWSVNLAISGTYMFEPSTVPSRLVSLMLTAYAVIVFASLAAALGAFFVEQRAEHAAAEE